MPTLTSMSKKKELIENYLKYLSDDIVEDIDKKIKIGEYFKTSDPIDTNAKDPKDVYFNGSAILLDGFRDIYKDVLKVVQTKVSGAAKYTNESKHLKKWATHIATEVNADVNIELSKKIETGEDSICIENVFGRLYLDKKTQEVTDDMVTIDTDQGKEILDLPDYQYHWYAYVWYSNKYNETTFFAKDTFFGKLMESLRSDELLKYIPTLQLDSFRKELTNHGAYERYTNAFKQKLGACFKTFRNTLKRTITSKYLTINEQTQPIAEEKARKKVADKAIEKFKKKAKKTPKSSKKELAEKATQEFIAKANAELRKTAEAELKKKAEQEFIAKANAELRKTYEAELKKKR